MLLLSKSKYLIGLQCPKLLWMHFNDKESLPPVDESTQHIFDQGHLIGELAKKVFPKGIDIEDKNFIQNIEESKKLLGSEDRKPLFEVAIKVELENGSIYSRADILNPIGEDEWDIIEVKSSTEIKDVNIQDVSFQKYVYEKSGLKIRNCFLMHINNQYVKNGEIEPRELFHIDDITEDVERAIEGIESRIDNMFKIIQSKNAPKVCIGPYCKDPYECDLIPCCWEDMPDNSVFELYRLGKKAFDLYDRGILEIKNIPESYNLNDKQFIQKQAIKSGKEHINKKEIKKWLDGLTYPLYYLDFETFNPAIPKYDGMKPYQQIPFQFSLHIQKEKDGELEHISFLAEGIGDPRPKFLQALKDNLGKEGDIVVYNQSFEKSRIKECALAFPEFEKWSEEILRRIVDLWDVFKAFDYYHPSQKGSASIKKVLPALSDLSYNKLEIAKGEVASREFERVTFSNLTSEEIEEAWNDEAKRVREALEKYCELDTLAEVEIVKKLGGMVKPNKLSNETKSMLGLEK